MPASRRTRSVVLCSFFLLLLLFLTLLMHWTTPIVSPRPSIMGTQRSDLVRYPVSLSMVELNLASLCASSMLIVSPQRATCPARPFAMEKRNSFSPSRKGSSGAFDWPKIHETRFLLRPWLAPRVTINSPLSRSTKNSVQRSQS